MATGAACRVHRRRQGAGGVFDIDEIAGLAAIVIALLFVAFAGGAIGILLALLVGNVSLRYPMGALRLDPDLPSRLVGMLAALASGLLGGIVPAVRAVRIPLVEAIGGRS